jgi:Asp-tRNA(Asn)/Glu-tRNA(Gln) amidotransferase A subunit family amidase
MKGVRTDASNRAYNELYPPKGKSAPLVQRLVDLGAIIVGKTKTSTFADREAPSHWIDTHAPFNPRGDGYLITGGSSAGSASAMASYAWLDFAVGSDSMQLNNSYL